MGRVFRSASAVCFTIVNMCVCVCVLVSLQMYNQLSVLDGRHKRHLDAILTKLKTGGDIGVIDTDKTEVHRPGVTSALRAGDRRDGKSTGSVPSASLSGSARFGADRMPWGEDDKMALSE